MLRISSCTPVRIVDSVEDGIAFWRDRFGFTVENQVPDDVGKLIFASVTNGTVEVMYQTKASVLADTPESMREAKTRVISGDATALFLHVNDIDAVEHALLGAQVEKARHNTFYGTTEIYVREPSGMVVGFSAPTAAPHA